MSTSTTSNNQTIDPALVQQAEQLLRAFAPNADPQRLSVAAARTAVMTQAAINAASNETEWKKQLQDATQIGNMFLLKEQKAIAESTIVKYNEKKEHILTQRNLNLLADVDLSIEKEVNAEIQAAKMDAIQEAKELSKETCTTCKIPNQFIDKEGKVQKLLQQCSRCKTALYCSVACQKRDWPQHKVNCIKK